MLTNRKLLGLKVTASGAYAMEKLPFFCLQNFTNMTAPDMLARTRCSSKIKAGMCLSTTISLFEWLTSTGQMGQVS